MTQRNDILDYLKSGRSLTPLSALDLFGCLRLGARIYDLKAEGYRIVSEQVETPSGKHVARYSLLVAEPVQEALW